ncbi:preprotein translocase subunit SecG [Subdoligranulum sp. DSM 109015]|uniref:Protein-export membrane protein SecG n=1 Tax=Gemmiger gallinarum TaxID=2779354 RepID=A0ABR9R0P2_9FIRM|nr:preprotein translocase subunit SecG [Gemmiger gallinarum]MBE5036669.1 preprotein translocase subunit SecG [Gemmiger gallinarum]HIX17230.1 preprotein translocase subunit SecG [Candidatus Gemmiger faecavium]
MSVYEIVFGVILVAVSLFIIVFTLAQESKGQGLSAAIMGDNSFMAAGRERGIDAKLAKATKVCGAIFFVATLVVCVLSARLG